MALALAAALVMAATAAATDWTVTKTADTNDGTCSVMDCSLREAVGASGAGDTVIVPSSVDPYVDSLGSILINHALTIHGDGAAASILENPSGNRVGMFYVNAPYGTTITVDGVTVRNSTGISVPSSASLTLSGVVVRDNIAGGMGGGGVEIDGPGTLTLTNTTITANKALVSSNAVGTGGGGVRAGGPVVATDSHIDGNMLELTTAASDTTAGYGSGGGGLLMNSSVDSSLTRTTVNGNTATITGGQCCHGGGGIFRGPLTADATLTLTDTTVNGNTLTVNGTSGTTMADEHCCSGGGGAYIASGLTMLGGSMSGNTATINAGDCCHGGGGVLFVGERSPADITDAALTGNHLTVNGSGADSGGGGIFDYINPATALPHTERFMIEKSLVSGNVAELTGGATASGGGGVRLDLDGANAITNSTISDNSTTGDGGGLFASKIAGQPQKLTLSNATIAGNSATGGHGAALSSALDVRSRNTILSGGCLGLGGGTFTSLGYNLGDLPDTCGFSGTGDKNVVPASMGLDGLADNGGPTKTRALQPSSPAVEGGNPAGCADDNDPLTADQRGLTRPFGPLCDIGAFELQSAGTGGPGGGGPGGGGPGGGGPGVESPFNPIPISRSFSIKLRHDKSGDIAATLVSRSLGAFAAKSTFTAGGSSKPAPFDTDKTTAASPGLVELHLIPSHRARAALASHKRLVVKVSITYTPSTGPKTTKSRSINVRIPGAGPVPAPPHIPTSIDVRGATTVAMRGDPPSGGVFYFGSILYNKVTDFFRGTPVPTGLAEVAGERCTAAFDAGGPKAGVHTAALVFEILRNKKYRGSLNSLTGPFAGLPTTLTGNGDWSRIVGKSYAGAKMLVAVGVYDKNEFILYPRTLELNYKSHTVFANCYGAVARVPYTGPPDTARDPART